MEVEFSKILYARLVLRWVGLKLQKMCSSVTNMTSTASKTVQSYCFWFWSEVPLFPSFRKWKSQYWLTWRNQKGGRDNVFLPASPPWPLLSGTHTTHTGDAWLWS
eukprot:1137043-Pelagomonas_calceolata.AAC.1